MKTTITIIFIALFSLLAADDLSDCKCWSGYKATKTDDGIRCLGVFLLHAMDCNEPEKPECTCTGDVNGILVDATGTWCVKYEKSEDPKKWACENKEEWEAFYKKYPNEKP